MLFKIFINYLIGYVNVQIEGYYIERFITSSIRSGILLWGIKRKNSNLVLAKVSTYDLEKLKENARNNQCLVTVKSQKGVPYVIKKYSKRKSFAISLLILITINLVLSKFIWNIEVTGNTTISSDDIIKIVNDEGLNKGTLKSKIKTEKIINKIRLSRDDISWVGIDIKGTNAIISIVEAKEKPDIIDENDFTNIVATKDGVITKAYAQNGTLMVTEGDEVKKGDVLISGKIEEKYTEPYYVNAVGEIKAKVLYSKTVKVNKKEIKRDRTGKKNVKFAIKINDFKINLFKTLSKFKNYDTIYTNKKIRILPNFYLPIEICKYTNYEVNLNSVDISEDEAKQIGENEAKNELKSFITDKEVSNNYTEIDDLEDCYNIKVVYEIIEDIGTKEKINNWKGKMAMGMEEKSLKIYGNNRTFFSKIGVTFSKIFAPTKNGLNSLLIGMKRSSMLKNYKNYQKAEGEKKAKLEQKFKDSYSLYLESIDQLIINTIYQKVKEGTASDFEKDALSKYYNVIRIKDTDKDEYKFKKQQYLLDIDYNSLKSQHKDKIISELDPIYLFEMEQIYKGLLKRYSIQLSENISPKEMENVYEKIFDTLEKYVIDIVPMKEYKDEDLKKQFDRLSEFEIGKLDQVDIIRKKMILTGISRKLFVHSLPLVVAERCYKKLLKETRELIVDTKIARKKENAFELLLELIDEYNDRLLLVKMYWDKPDEKRVFKDFDEKRKILNAQKEQLPKHAFDVKRQIIYIRADMKILEKFGNKYYRILEYYRKRLVNLGDIKPLKNKCKTGTYQVIYGLRKLNELNETAC